ncbi:hypothetical protein M430DRAFT_63598 [Amorphotheca resinae ATCC 22711]|uniref:FAD-binding domain-containing protein n=1 Tax=Amorphotheca resinae ATCC 22711 TaxID=857342 RepID=A0A2T3B9E1_AMORE|nr:hypothetical protein M430DRAFT_63598 [Amorphotheca resinae ATCC 22711]PSS24941.1 hypothetical protein M430DRAFT_63598 [Amorphotheca resinae ATCC 22711]
MPATLKILICGGGIAGNALAFWLSKLGNDVTVVERWPSLRVSGQQLDLRGPGIEIMKRMGLEKAFRSKQVGETGIEFVDSSGRQRAFFPVNKTGKGLQSFTTDFEIMRGDLCRILYDATKDHVKYIFGMSVESFEQDDNSVEVQFSNGSKGRFDLLVGADGQGSRTRKMMLSPDGPDPFYSLHMYIAYFSIPRVDEEYIATSYLATNKRGIFTRRHDPHTVQAYLFYLGDSDKLENAVRSDVREQKKVWAELFQDAGWKAQRIIKAMQDDSVANDFFTHQVGQVRMDSWSRGRVVLVGDAAYCPSPATGMGTTSGLVGAYVLAGEIAKHLNRSNGVDNADGAAGLLASALEAYNSQLRPFVSQVQQLGPLWVPASCWGISIFNFLIGLAASLRLDILGRYVLRENIQWDTPEYAELPQLGSSE